MPDDLGRTAIAPSNLSSQAERIDERPPPQVPASDWATLVLALFITAGFFGLLLVLCYHQVPSPNLAMMNIVLGSLGTAWVGAMAYFFGSSRSSRTKDWMLFQSQAAGPTAGTSKG